MKHRLRPWTVAKSLLVVIAILAIIPLSPSASAQEASPEGAQFNIRPLDIQGSYFDIEMQAGETRSLAVELGNFGDVEAEALTYAADAFTLVNGGMGVRNIDEAPTGTTLWLDYAHESVTLAPDTAITQTFQVTVPADATPGEYLTTLVIQEAAPSAPDTASGESITFNTLTRQAIAVAVTVPGEMAPVLEIGAATHSIAGSNSVVSFELTNSGNERSVPAGTFTLVDESGTTLTTHDVNLGAIYAGDSTLVEIPFNTILSPGSYSVSLKLADESRGITAEAVDVPLTVEPPAQPVNSAEGSDSRVAVIDQQPETAAGPVPGSASPAAETSSDGMPVWMLGAGIAVALIVGAGAAAGVLAIMRRRRAGTEPASPEVVAEPAPSPAPDPIVVPARPDAVAPAARTNAPVPPRRLPIMRQLSVPNQRIAATETNARGGFGRATGESAGD